MNKLISLIILSVIMAGCSSNVKLGRISLGQDKQEVLESLEANEMRISFWDNIIGAQGLIYLLDTEWNKVQCVFKDGKLNEVRMTRPYSNMPTSSIENVKKQMRELCGDGYNSVLEPDLPIAAYGTDSHNKGCLGGIEIGLEDDIFFATIKLAN